MKWLHELKTLKILGKVYDVEYVLPAEPLVDSGKVGRCDWATGKIHIIAGLKDDVLLDVLLHEILHAINQEMDCHLEEEHINRIAAGLQAVLTDNFQLLPRKES